MNELFSVKDKVVVMTGGTGVLGRCISAYLAEQGAKMVVIGRNGKKGAEIIDGINAKGGEGIFIEADVLDTASVQKACDLVMERYRL